MLCRGSFFCPFFGRTFVRPLSDFFLFPAPAAGAGFHDLHACCRAGSLPGILLRCPDDFLTCCPCGSSPPAAALVLLLLPDLSPWTAAWWRLLALCPLLPSLVGSLPCFACSCLACCPGGAPPAALLPLWASLRMDSPPGRLDGGSAPWCGLPSGGLSGSWALDCCPPVALGGTPGSWRSILRSCPRGWSVPPAAALDPLRLLHSSRICPGRMESPPGRLVGRLGSLVWPFSGCVACCRICLRFRAGSCCPARSSPAAALPGIFSGWMERPLRPPRWMARRSLSDLLHGLRLRASARDPPDGLQLVPVLPCAIVRTHGRGSARTWPRSHGAALPE